MKLCHSNVLPEGLKIAVSLVGGRGAFKQEHLEGEQGRWEDVNDLHGNVAIFDASARVGDFFVKLVSSIYCCSHETVEIIMVRQFDVLIFSPHVEFCSSTDRFI